MTTTKPTTTSIIYSTTHAEDLSYSTETTDFFATYQLDNDEEEFVKENEVSTAMPSTTASDLGIYL